MEYVQLSDAKFQEIFTDKAFRNAVAYSHQVCKPGGEFKHWGTCTHPQRYIITPEQKQIANQEIEKDKTLLISNLGNKLLFVGMGSQYIERYNDDICNHRIRTEFVNNDNKRFFIEVGTGTNSYMRVDHAIDRDLENEYDLNASKYRDLRNQYKRYTKEWSHYHELFNKYMEQPYNNYDGLEKLRDIPYTKNALLNLINEHFNCSFTQLEIDNYTLSTDDFCCISPKI